MALLNIKIGGSERLVKYVPPVKGKVVIGGRTYPTVRIGTQTWLAKNLDYAWSGLPIGQTADQTNPRANYYNNSQNTYGWDGKGYGLLYNWAAANYLNEHRAELCPGWHVPTFDEWSTLATSVGGDNIAGRELKANTSDWGNYKGLDTYGFSVLPSGRRSQYSEFAGVNENAQFWTMTTVSTSNAREVIFYSGNTMSNDQYSMKYQYSLRLVKDVT